MKIFCIGFHKTGTKSLGLALGILGYKVTGPNVPFPHVNKASEREKTKNIVSVHP